MTRIERKRIAAPALGLAVVLGCGVCALAADRLKPLMLVNESPSLPRGLYLRQLGGEPGRGDITAVPQPAAARAYLGSLGMPGDVALIKRVAAIGGDEVCAGPGIVVMATRRVAVRARDGSGAPLPAWRGCRRLAADELFLLGDTASSFDSRHFGPVRRAETTGLYREVITW